MRVLIEPPEGWGPRRVLAVRLERMGYRVAEQHGPAAGQVALIIT